MANRIDIILTAETIDEINSAIETIRGKLNFDTSLNPEESKRLLWVDAKRNQFMQIAFELAEANSYLQSPFMNYAESKRDLTAFDQLGLIDMALLELRAKVTDLLGLTGNGSIKYGLSVYEQSQMAMKKGIPGANAAYEQMKPFFEKTKLKKDEKK